MSVSCSHPYRWLAQCTGTSGHVILKGKEEAGRIIIVDVGETYRLREFISIEQASPNYGRIPEVC